MKTAKILTILVLALGLIVCQVKVSEAAPLSDAFTYQGRLIDANNAAEGLYDFQFRLFDDPNVVDGNQVGSDVNKPDVDAIDGYFTVELDFGSSVFNGNARWLEIGVRPGVENDPCGYTLLSPRQEVTAVPYALQTRGIFVDDALKVGIGATSPNWRLTIEEGGLNVFAGGSGETVGFSTSRFYVANNNEDSLMDIRESPSDFIRFSNNGGDVMTIINEKVGIGTQSPVGKLHVDGGKAMDGTWGADIVIKAQDGGDGWAMQNNGEAGGDIILLPGEGGEEIGAGLPGPDGNVGIGTTNPTAKLEVAGDAKITGSLFAGSGPTVLFVDDTSDMVGIGTTSPRTQLEILGTTGLRVTTGDHTNVYGDFKHAYSGGLIINANAGGGGFADMSFQTNATTKMFIESSGNVGIGTTSPTSKLQVTGDEVRIGDGGVVNYATGDGDLYVENVLEVDGKIRASNMPGCEYSDFPNSPIVHGPWTNVGSISLTLPEDGYIIVTFTGTAFFNDGPGLVFIAIGLTPTESNNLKSTMCTGSTYDYIPFCVQHTSYFNAVGTVTYYGNATASIWGANLENMQMTAIYVPVRY